MMGITPTEHRPLSAVQTAVGYTVIATTTIALAIIFGGAPSFLSAAFATTAGLSLITLIVVSALMPPEPLPEGQELPLMGKLRALLLRLGQKETDDWDEAFKRLSRIVDQMTDFQTLLLVHHFKWLLEQLPEAFLPPGWHNLTSWALRKTFESFEINEQGVSGHLAKILNPLIKRRKEFGPQCQKIAVKLGALMEQGGGKQALLKGLEKIFEDGIDLA